MFWYLVRYLVQTDCFREEGRPAQYIAAWLPGKLTQKYTQTVECSQNKMSIQRFVCTKFERFRHIPRRHPVDF